MRLGIFRDVFLNPSDAMTFRDIPDCEVTMLGQQSWVGPIPGNMTIQHYKNIEDVDLTQFDVVDGAELFHPWTKYLVEHHPNAFVTVWDNIPYNMFDQIISTIILEKAAGFIARSELTYHILKEIYKVKQPVHYIPAAVDMDLFKPGPKTEMQDAKTIIYVGRMTWEKGLFDLVYACIGQPNWRLLLIGDGPIREATMSLAAFLGVSAEWLGVKPHHEVPAYLHQADVFALPSIPTGYWVEQFGISVIEALACEVPVVTSCIGEFPVFKKVAPWAVYTVPPSNFVALREGIKSALKTPDEKRWQAREAMGLHYSSKVVGKRIGYAYSQVKVAV